MDKQRSAPRHERVAAELRRRIVAGRYAVGDPLPSEAMLTAEFGVSRGTLRQALAALRSEQLIGGGQGRPPVVRSAVAAQPFETLMSFTSWAEQSGRIPGQRTIELARRGASQSAADALHLEEGEPVIVVLRLRTLDGVPVMVERATFPLAVGRYLFDLDIDAGSIYAGLTAAGVDLHGATHTFDAVAAEPTDAELLTVPVGTPLLRERRIAQSAAGEPLEYGEDRYLPGKVAFTVRNTQASADSWARTANVS